MPNSQNNQINWGDEAQKYGPRITNWGWRMYNQPSAPVTAPPEGGSGLASYTAPATSEGTSAGEGALSNLGEANWAAYAPYLSVVAPLIMGYSAYTAGSGRNEPVEKGFQTRGAGRMLSDLAGGKQVDPANTLDEYGLPVKNLPSWMTGGDSTSGTGEGVVDPRGYTPYDLYDLMHSYTSGRPQTGGLGNSGYSDQQVDQMFPNQAAVAKILGVNNLPDWNQYTNQGFPPGQETPYSVGHPQVKMNSGWDALGEAGQRAYVDRANQLGPGSDSPQNLWEKEQQLAEVEKLLGHKLNYSG